MNKYLSIFALTLFVSLLGSCGEDSDGDGNDGNGSEPSHQVDASIEGGEASGSVQGEANESQPNVWYGQVAGGELVVYLGSSDGSTLFFRVRTAGNQLPGSSSVTRTLDDTAYLTYTSPTAQIYEGNSGNIVVDVCPNILNTVVTGRFDNIGLTNTMTESSGGTLNGTWKVVVAVTDQSATCDTSAADPEPDAGSDVVSDGGGPSPGPSCPNETCDGPCCPYLPALQECYVACSMTVDCMDPIMGDPMTCMACYAGCPDESGMTADDACMSAANALDSCMTTHECEVDDLTGENACIEANCCSEYQAVF